MSGARPGRPAPVLAVPPTPILVAPILVAPVVPAPVLVVRGIAARRFVACGLLACGLAACARPAPPAPAIRYLVGQPYALGGVWSYPREDFAAAAAGIAAVLPDRRAGRPTANGEAHDPDRLVAAHRTLQLPAILTVTNLENGLEIAVRVNDRGPAQPGRIVGLSRRAGELLGIPADGAAQVRIAVEGAPSRALAQTLPGDPAQVVAIATAPRGVVETEALAPPSGARGAEPRRQAPAGTAPRAAPPAGLGPEPALPPDPLPEVVTRRPATPGRPMVEAGTFFRRDLAQQQAARLSGLGARVEALGTGRQPQYRVRIGPFDSLGEADRALAGVLAAGRPEASLTLAGPLPD